MESLADLVAYYQYFKSQADKYLEISNSLPEGQDKYDAYDNAQLLYNKCSFVEQKIMGNSTFIKLEEEQAKMNNKPDAILK